MGSRFQKRRRSSRDPSRSRRGRGHPREPRNRDANEELASVQSRSPEGGAGGPEAVAVNTLPETLGNYLPVLFRQFPELLDRIPWVSLRGASEPSLPRHLVRSHHLFGPNHFFMKEEFQDFHIISENHARKLEFYLGKLASLGVRKLIAQGDAGDSSLLAVAVAARELGLKAKIYLTKPSSELSFEAVERTLALFGTGATVRPKSTENALHWSLKFQEWVKPIVKSEFVPKGIQTASGALGYANAFLELKQQIDDGLAHAPDYLFIAAHQGASLAGLEVGRRLAGLESVRIVGVQTDPKIKPNAEEIARLANEAGARISKIIPKLGGRLNFSAKDFTFYADPELFEEPKKGDSKRKEFSLVRRWIIRFEETEMTELGPDDNARALYSISRYVAQNKLSGKKLLFWNTYCPFRKGDVPSTVDQVKIPGLLKSWLLQNPDFKRQMTMRALPTSSKKEGQAYTSE